MGKHFKFLWISFLNYAIHVASNQLKLEGGNISQDINFSSKIIFEQKFEVQLFLASFIIV